MRLSVVVPVKNGAEHLERTLPALVAALPAGAELIVSDDGSRDASADVARRYGARVVHSHTSAGPAAARNRGAREASGDVLAFLDADVRVHPDTLERLLRPLSDPNLAAVFGSYDATPAARSWVSLYKNLAHHFVHQRSAGAASTFWAGCGAVRAGVFRDLLGFDERYARASIEDVELGYRLRERGHRIELVPDAQVTHLKRWTLASFLAADLRDRAVPWARLLRCGRRLPPALNFTAKDRAATASVGLGLLFATSGPWLGVPALVAAVACFATAVALDLPFLAFAARSVSPVFAIVAAALQLLHRVAGLVGLVIGMLVR